MSAVFAVPDVVQSRELFEPTPTEAPIELRSSESEGAFHELPHDLPHDLLNALPVAVYTTDSAGRITFYNQAAAELWGHRPELGKGEWCGSWRLYWPDGRPLPHDQCPMAVAIKEKRQIRGAEAVAERPDGVRAPFLAYPTPLYDKSGALVGAVNTLVDITERKRAELASRQLALIVQSSDDAIVSKDLNGIITTWNRGAELLFGYEAEEVIGQPIMILIPEDHRDEESTILERIRRGERIDHYETVRRRKDGSSVDISLSVSPVTSSAGGIVGASKIARDISERKRAQDQQNLLLREMSHRVKNLLAVTSSVVTLSARSAATPEEMARALRERLGALSRAHDLTQPSPIDAAQRTNHNTTLHALVEAIFSPYADLRVKSGRSGNHEPFTAEGPNLPIGGSAVTSLALILHEFATNAAKYGALSSRKGLVRISWTAENNKLLLTWKESSGPTAGIPPEKEGFGTLLARRIMAAQFGGQISRVWGPDGLTIHLSLPVERLTQ
jgi:PAS domain S-box-containing protein